ncbi:protease complex subunit PrcB family protein [Brevibacillus daliensis]|uniref:protease complex subunit PrcB family protein n=1 Tax=Brevibacillus daliensis TaxID=2892995 RepID=UPI001E532D9B|nr:protease complex subunit PrcB family protein [Brevibacillus daliensis]
MRKLMNKTLISVLSIASMFSLSLSSVHAEQKVPEVAGQSLPAHSKVVQMDSSKVVSEESLSQKEKAFLNEMKQTKGIHQMGDLFVIARGEMPNNGYNLKVTRTVQSWEQLFVYIELSEPDPDQVYVQQITYPYVLVRAQLPPYTTISFLDDHTQKPLFQ